MDNQPDAFSPATLFRPHRVAWVSYLLVASTVAVFLAQLHFSDGEGHDPLGEALAFSPQAWADGRYWTLLTSAWAHATGLFGVFWLHLATNMITLFFLGPALEDAIGHVRFLVLYLASAIMASLTWFAFNLESPEAIIGASGAVFGIIAAAGVVAPRARVQVFIILIPIRLSMGLFALCTCAAEAVQAVFHFLPQIAHQAHLGGAACGALFGLACRRWPPGDRLSI